MTEAERWLPVVGFEGYHEVSDQGRIWSLDRLIQYKDGRTRQHRGALRALVLDTNGYLTVNLRRCGSGGVRRVHRLVLEAFRGACPKGMYGCHNNGVCTDNCLTNLRYDSPAANRLDQQLHGTDPELNRTHCLRGGHLLAPPNLKPAMLAEGRRGCLACHRAHGNAAWALAQGREFDFRAAADRHYRRIMCGRISDLVRLAYDKQDPALARG